jgi:hypothetical protein
MIASRPTIVEASSADPTPANVSVDDLYQHPFLTQDGSFLLPVTEDVNYRIACRQRIHRQINEGIAYAANFQ